MAASCNKLINMTATSKDSFILGSGMRVPLNRAQEGVYCVAKVSGKDETKKHLKDLGFIEGTAVHVFNEFGGSVMVEVKGVKLGLGVELAKRVMVIA